MLVAEIKSGDLAYGALAILVGVAVRMIAVTFGVYFPRGKYNLKERVFMAMCWFPKANVQAALGSLILFDSKKTDNLEMQHYGNLI